MVKGFDPILFFRDLQSRDKQSFLELQLLCLILTTLLHFQLQTERNVHEYETTVQRGKQVKETDGVACIPPPVLLVPSSL